MGKALSVVKNPFKNFNVESRAHKVISQAKPKPAPKYKADEATLDKLIKEYPEVYEESQKKNPELNKYLKNVYVTSQNENPKVPENPNRPLPANRSAVDIYEFGFQDPENVPLGKISLRNALQFITNHQADPIAATSQSIAKEHSIPEETVKNVLNYFKVYEVYVPVNRTAKAKFAGPSQPKVEIIKEVRKAIDSGQKEPGS
ncbi:unnamed protein product [Brassicogethes aeneus]|uniref:NDUFAF4-like protein n=1 Tax=Brassicogethes aeneus TaxID=1431903 RepID=A0A9P0FH77_BRAAE|nr:unnamed protein product [Brassicogethes aeneus]